MFKQVLINVEATDIRVAILEDSALVELFVEQFNSKSTLGNIYKGVVEAIVPGLKAVFVNIGLEKNAFLHFSDILQEYELPDRGRPERLQSRPAPVAAHQQEGPGDFDEDDEYIEPQAMPDEDDEAPPIQRQPKSSRPLRVGDTLLVQVVKESLGDKGPRVTSYISIPGRYLVMMPFSEHQGGVSRKITDMDDRRRLRDLLRSLKPEAGAFIIRTAGLEEEEGAIREDFEALQNQWKTILRKNIRIAGGALIYNEADIIQRLVRDTLRNDIDEILIDSRDGMKKLLAACETMATRMMERAHLFESSKNIFEVFEVEKQFQKALRRKVFLKSGGAIVIDETEALTAIDVNSGKYVGKDDQDSVILKTNIEACEGISRQLRLRDLGGLVVIDFIDMTNRDHQQQVLRELRGKLRRDNAKFSMTGFSEFGLVEMTRKRTRVSLAKAIYRQCPYCEGSGKILGEPHIWKLIKYSVIEELSKSETIEKVDVIVNSDMRKYLEKEVLADLKAIAGRFKARLNFIGQPDFHHEKFQIITHEKSTTEEDNAKVTRKTKAPAEKKGTKVLNPPPATG